MKLAIPVLLSFAVMSQVHAAKPCEELKSEIAAKLDAKGVQNYVLEIVPADQETDLRVVGTCEGGTKKITYVRN